MLRLRKMKSEQPYSPLQDVVASATVETACRTPDILIYQIVDALFAACENTNNTAPKTNPVGNRTAEHAAIFYRCTAYLPLRVE